MFLKRFLVWPKKHYIIIIYFLILIIQKARASFYVMLKKTSGIWTVKFQKYWNLKKIWFVCKTMTCWPIWMIVPSFFEFYLCLPKKQFSRSEFVCFPQKNVQFDKPFLKKFEKFLGKFSYRKSQFAVGNRQTITIKISFSNTSNKILSK